MIKPAYLLLSLVGFILCGCVKQPAEEILVYENLFERNLIDAKSRVDSSYVSFHNFSENYFEFNGSRNLGRFGTGGMTLTLEGLPEHQLIRLEFELYIHDKWEGYGLRGNTQDVFILNVDDLNVHFDVIVNTKCLTHDCDAIQSFPNRLGGATTPENASVTDPTLPGVCFYKDEIGGSKLIKFANVYRHQSNKLVVNIAAGIKDAGPDLCLKSWSIDNLRIRTVSLPEL